MKDYETSASGRPLWEGHRARLRQHMEREGWDALKPYEMLELVLFHAVPRQDLSDVARLLVDRFGSVGGVFSASREQLLAVPGVTERLAEWIGLTGGLVRAYYDLHAQRDIRLGCYQEAVDFLRPRLGDAGDAGQWAIYVDFDFNLITYSAFDRSRPWWDAANARRMLSEAIGNGARYVFLVRWMEAGEALELNAEEFSRLEAIAATLRAADLDLVDCLLAGDGEICSLNVQGRLENIRAESGCMELHERYSIQPDDL